MRRVINLVQSHPVEVVAAVMVGGIMFLVAMWLLRIRRGMPTVLFGCFFICQAAASNFGPLQIVSKGIFRWVALAALAGASLLYLHRSRERVNRFTGVHWGCLVFVLLALLSFTYSDYPRYTFLRVVSVFLVFVAAFVTAWYYASDEGGVLRIIDVITKLAALILVLGFVMIPAPGTRSFDGGRFLGFFGNANGNGTFFAMMLPLFLWRFHYERKTPWRQVWLGILAVAIVNIVLSGSRGAMSAGLIAGAITQARLDKRRLATGLVIVLALAGTAGLTRIGVAKFRAGTEKLAREESLRTLTHRTEMWRAAWPHFRRSPLLGIGFGTSRFVLMEEESAESAAGTIGASAAALHSEHVEMLIEMGVMGYAFLLGFIVYVVYLGMNAFQRGRAPMPDLSVALFGVILVVFADMILHSWILSAGNSQCVLFWIIVTMFLKTTVLARSMESPTGSWSIHERR